MVVIRKVTARNQTKSHMLSHTRHVACRDVDDQLITFWGFPPTARITIFSFSQQFRPLDTKKKTSAHYENMHRELKKKKQQKDERSVSCVMPFIDILHTNPHKYTHNNDRFQFSKHLMSFFFLSAQFSLIIICLSSIATMGHTHTTHMHSASE